MSRDVERIQDMTGQLVAGWHERREYAVKVDGHAEFRVDNRYQPSLIAQLATSGRELAGLPQGGGTNYNKPGSRPPGNTAPLHHLDFIECSAWEWYGIWYHEYLCRPVPTGRMPLALLLAELLKLAEKGAHTHPWLVQRYGRDLTSWVRRSRVILGYDKPDITLKDVVCGECGGVLVVASDASSDVRCIGTDDVTSCGVVYPRWRWLEMMT